MFHCLPDSAWAIGNLAEAARQNGGTPKLKSTQVFEQVGHPVAFILRSVPCCRAGADVAVPDLVGVVAAAVEPLSIEPLSVGKRSCSRVHSY